MEQLSTILGSLFFVIVQVGVFFTSLFFCLTPIRTKPLKKFTIVTLLFIAYNVFNQAKDFWGDYLSIISLLYITTLLLLLFFISRLVARVIQQQRGKGYKAILLFGLSAPLIIILTTLFQEGFLLENVSQKLFISFPTILSMLIAILFYGYRGLSKKHQLRAVLSAGLLVASSLAIFIIRENYNKNFHFLIVNLNFSVLTIFIALLHRRSILLVLYRGKRKSNLDPLTIEYFKQHQLTDRQIEIAQHIIDGKSYNEIAENCHLALNTVTKHASNIFKKFDVKDKDSFLEKTRQ